MNRPSEPVSAGSRPGGSVRDSSAADPRSDARGFGPARTVLTVAAALVGASLPVFLLSALAPAIQAELGFGEAALGVAVAAFFLAAAVSSVPGGRFADRFGAPTALRTGLGIAAAGSLSVAVFAGSRWSLAAAMFLGGTALGFVDTGGARAIAAAIPPSRQGFAFGSKEASIPTASFLAGASVPLLGSQLGWRAAFTVGMSIAVVIAALVSSRLEHPGEGRPRLSPPDGAASRSDREVGMSGPLVGQVRAAFGEENSSSVTSTPERDADSEVLAAVSRSRRTGPLLLLSVTATLGGGAAAATTAFLVASSVAGGLGSGRAGGLLAGASAAAIVARLTVGAAADRHANAAVPIVASMLVIGALGGAGLALGATSALLGAVWSPVILVTSAVLAIGSGWGWTGLVFLAAVRLDAERPAKAAGIVLAGLGLGGATGPALFGLLAGEAGYSGAWMATAAASVIAALTAFLAHRIAGSRTDMS